MGERVGLCFSCVVLWGDSFSLWANLGYLLFYNFRSFFEYKLYKVAQVFSCSGVDLLWS